MKNRIFYLLVMAMLLGFPSAASAQYFEVGGITYNVLSPMDVIESGIVIEVREVHPEKTSPPMDVVPIDMVTDIKEVHP